MNVRSTLGALALTAFATVSALAQTPSDATAPAGQGTTARSTTDPATSSSSMGTSMKAHRAKSKAKTTDSTANGQTGDPKATQTNQGKMGTTAGSMGKSSMKSGGTAPAANGGTAETAPGGK